MFADVVRKRQAERMRQLLLTRQIAQSLNRIASRQVPQSRYRPSVECPAVKHALKRQLVRFKDQLHEVRDRGGAGIPLDEASEDSEVAERRIIRTETYFHKPMSAEEAALQLDAIEKEFLVFIDVGTDEVAIIYHRRDGNYGLIEPRR